MKERNLTCFLCLFTLLCYAAAAQQPAPPTPSGQQPAAPAPAQTPATAAAPAETESDLVVVRVAGEPITEKTVLGAINYLSRQKIAPDPQQPRNVTLFKGAVDNLVIEALLRKQAREQKIAPDKAMVDQQMQALSRRFKTPEEFQKALAKQGLTEDQLRKEAEDSLSMQLVINEAVKNTPGPADTDVEKFYNDNSQSFELPEQAHAAHILLLADEKSTPAEKEEIRKKLEGIRADIEANKITFADAAKKYSQDPGSASSGGDLGFFSRGQMVKPFEDAAFSGKSGALSPIVETQYGFHIIQTIEIKPAGKMTLEEAKPRIKQVLDQLNKTKAVQQYTKDLKAQAEVESFMTPEEFLKRHPDIK